MKTKNTQKETKNCVYCGNAAKFWSCHVIVGKTGEKLVAGWCSQGCRDALGFVGHYKKWMGTRK